MKSKIMIVAALTLITVILGCQSPRGGGRSGGEGFKIITPALDMKIKQGETQNVTIALKRGENFKRDVKLEIRASEGISVTPTSVWIKGSDQPETQLQITAPKAANLGEYRIYIKGTPETGEATSIEFGVKVVAP